MIAQKAQQEARERAQKRKMLRAIPLDHGISKRFRFEIKDDEQEETPQPFIEVQFQNREISTFALSDTGANGNTMSYEFFRTLTNVDLQHTNAHFQTFTKQITGAKGVCEVQMYVSELTCGDKFFVTQPLMQDIPILLGRSWQQKHNCFFNWERQWVYCQSQQNRIWVPLLSPTASYAQQVTALPTTEQ